MSNEACTNVAILDTLHRPGETESGSAGTQPDKGYPGLRCAKGASDPCRLTLSGVVSWMPLEIGAMPQKIQTRSSFQKTTYVYVRISRMNHTSSESGILPPRTNSSTFLRGRLLLSDNNLDRSPSVSAIACAIERTRKCSEIAAP